MSLTGINVSDECINQYHQMKLKKKYGYIIFKMDDQMNNIVIESTGEREYDYQYFLEQLPSNDCRYAIINMNFSLGEDGERSKNVLIHWNPSASSVKSRMIYASSKGSLKQNLEGIQIQIQGGSVDSIGYDQVLEECILKTR
eukprot:TRINITY_DN3090_c0_g2_i3.p1 TRINITY_DN3090_c0_g2~~TRINITY_DN3090_c0_g2_i3.p1  ORF type:complete len:151 (+),score=27.37 TRINITY_DN3090_c0_g2_i3:29-454(+)